MSIIITAIIILALIKIIHDNLFYLYLWQIKEYRTDRMRAYLRDKSAGSIVPSGLWSPNASRKISQNENAKRFHSPAAAGTMEPAVVIYFIGLALILVFYFNQQVFICLTLLFFTFTFYKILIEIKKL